MRGTSIAMGRMVKSVALGLAVCFLLTSCGEGEKHEREEQRVTAAQQCDDTLSPVAAKALITVMGTTKFDDMPRGGLSRAVDEVTSDYGKGKRSSTHGDMCTVRRQTSNAELGVDFGLYDPDPFWGERHPIDMYPYKGMGREAHAGFKRAYLFLECVSPRLKGSEQQPAHIEGRIDLDRPWPPDTVAIREANLTILHSVALALVKKLGCENNAGLPEKPILEPK